MIINKLQIVQIDKMLPYGKDLVRYFFQFSIVRYRTANATIVMLLLNDFINKIILGNSFFFF